MINIVCPSRYVVNRATIKQVATDFLVKNQISTRQTLNIVFIGTRKMREIARTYKKEDEALPVLAFAYHEIDHAGEQFLGEVMLCYPQVVLLAAERGKRVDVMIQQLLEHGVRNIIQHR